MQRRPYILKGVCRLLLAFACLSQRLTVAEIADDNTLAERPALRRPVAAAVLADGRTLAVANRRSGSISLVDLDSGCVLSEFAVGGRLTDLVLFPDRRRALVIDEGRNELLLLEIAADDVKRLATIKLPVQPASVLIGSGGAWATVSSTWSHAVLFVDLDSSLHPASPAPRITGRIDLSFAPRLQCCLRDGKLVVADAFGGHVALIDPGTRKLVAQFELAAHNIRGLAISADGRELVLAHQIVDEHLPTTMENIERGALVKNVLRRISLSELSQSFRAACEHSRVKELGMPEHGTADPAGLLAIAGDRVAVAFSGIGEVELGGLDEQRPESTVRLAVGRRPTALMRYGTAGLAVLNTFDDSVSLIDLNTQRVTRTISLGPMAALTPQDRGELFFFDGHLSRDGWLSCHSCHSEGHTNGRLADTLGDGTYGTPKRTLTLLGTGLTYRWAWNGSQQNLHDQVEKSLQQTMHGGTLPPQVVPDLTAYLIWLSPPPPLAPVTDDPGDRQQVARGEKVFHSRGCAECHIPPLVYTSHESYDVGLADEKGLTKFNPPSLRGVGQGYRFLHDNRAGSLGDVFQKIGHPHGQSIEGPELEDLLRFLKSL